MRHPLFTLPRRVTLPVGAFVALTLAASQAFAQSPKANWTLAERYSQAGLRSAIYSTNVQARWLGETDSMFYNWRDSKGSRFYLVVPNTRTKKALFDHDKLASQLSQLHKRPYDAHNLPFTTINFTKDHKVFRFNVDTARYEWELSTESLRRLPRLHRDSIPLDEERQVGGGGRGGRGGGGFNQAQGNWRNWSPDSTAFVFAREHNLYFVEIEKNDTIQISAGRNDRATHVFART